MNGLIVHAKKQRKALPIKPFTLSRILSSTILITALVLLFCKSNAQASQSDSLIYNNALSTGDTTGWVMEGPGQIEFADGWMQMQSPKQKGHHVFWCPPTLPASFIAEWEVKNLYPEAGLCIVFFAAKGINGEDIFAPSLPKRNGNFNGYIKGAINNYHISYYANGKDDPGREIANLRKNKGFYKVQAGQPGIPVRSTAVHKIRLIKAGGLIQMYIDERKVIDWTDNGLQHGKILDEGKLGFRQMKWTRFAYRNLKVWGYQPAK